jgi:hypothetical protein
MTTIQPLVVPRTERLPLESLGWDAFESFCRDLVSRMPGVRECHHYGKQGDTQLGIDLFADFDNGSRWAFQNKRWKEFGPADVEKAVQATTYPAQRYIILLSREATAGVRNAVAKHANWDIWDVRDISQKVRELPLDTARRLLDQHLGAGVRRAFLGVSAVSMFPTPEDYFGPFEDQSRIFHHGWSLVGRAELLQGLRNFATSTAKRVAVFSGRGGIGKSKLLHAFAADASQGQGVPTIRFLADGLPVTPEAFDDLPLSACLVVVDDAHRRGDDVAALLTLAQQCRPRIKLVLASRPQGMDLINSHLGRAGIEEREVERLGTVGDLTREETGRLAVQSLGEEYAHLADRLVALTRDCPLVTVVGGRLLAERAVDPALLESVDDFRTTVLSKFHDVLIGQVGDRIEASRCRSLLDLLAAVAPVRPDGEPFLTAAAGFLKCEPTELATAMAVLEECGVLLRRGYSVRITPDVLADHLLNRACLMPHGRPTGFAQRVFDHFSKTCPTEVLRNLAELDWRVRHATGQEPDLLASVWSGISDQFRRSPNSVRCQLLDVLRDIAYYQPGRMLELIEYAVRNPATTPEVEVVQHLGLFSHEGVLEKLPELVRRIAYTLDYLPCCADLLWELGRDDRRQANPRPEHPIRILCGMAEYEIGKPYAFNDGMIDAVRRWLREPGAHDHAHSPLDILDPIFVKSGSGAYSEGHSIAIRTFKVSSEDTQAMRDAALSLVGDCLSAESPRVVLRALKTLRAAISGPMPLYSMTFTADNIAQWEPEQLRILAMLAELRRRTTDSLVHLQISETVGWHARYASSPDVRRQAREIILSLPDQFDVRFARTLVVSHDRFMDADFDEETTEAFHRRHERQTALCRTVAGELWERTSNPEALARELNRQLQCLQAGGRETNGGFLIDALVHNQPQVTEPLIELIIAAPDCPLAASIALLLAHARHRDLSRGIEFARRVIASGHLSLCRAVGNLYCWSINWSEDGFEGDLAVLRSLLRHPDRGVVGLGIGGIRGLSRVRREAAVAEVLTVELSESGELAEELFSVFHAELGIPLGTLADADIDCLLRKLPPVNRLDHHVTQFLAHATSRRPHEVVNLLLDRVERGEAASGLDFEPLPYLGLHPALTALAECRDYDALIRLVRDRSLRVDYRATFWFPKLFKEVSLRYCPASLTALTEWIDSGQAERIAAATVLLTEAPAAFVFEHRHFVSNTLVRAFAAGDECYRRVCHHLRQCAAGHGRQRVGGGPFPQDVGLRDRASSVCATLRRGSPDHRFYDSLRAEAVANIRETEASDEELLG